MTAGLETLNSELLARMLTRKSHPGGPVVNWRDTGSSRRDSYLASLGS